MSSGIERPEEIEWEGFDRPGNVELQKAMKHLVRYLAKYGTGVASRDRARWAIRYGVNRDTSRKYWSQLIDAGAITGTDVDGKYKKTPYFNELLERELTEEQRKSAGPTPKPKQKLTLVEMIDARMKKDTEEAADLRAKMLAGPCAHECMFDGNPDCRKCGMYRDLKNKKFLEEE